MAHVLSIGQVQASKSTPSTAYLAINTAHGLYAAFYACYGSPLFINFWLSGCAQDFIIAREPPPSS
eukprot:702509-Pleurochrysis_carterae.AAC.1